MSEQKRIHIPHALDASRPEDVVDADDVFVVEAEQDLDLPQRALAVRLVLKRADLLDGHAAVRHVVQGRAVRDGTERQKVKRSSSYTTAPGTMRQQCPKTLGVDLNRSTGFTILPSMLKTCVKALYFLYGSGSQSEVQGGDR